MRQSMVLLLYSRIQLRFRTGMLMIQMDVRFISLCLLSGISATALIGHTKHKQLLPCIFLFKDLLYPVVYLSGGAHGAAHPGVKPAGRRLEFYIYTLPNRLSTVRTSTPIMTIATFVAFSSGTWIISVVHPRKRTMAKQRKYRPCTPEI